MSRAEATAAQSVSTFQVAATGEWGALLWRWAPGVGVLRGGLLAYAWGGTEAEARESLRDRAEELKARRP